MRDFLRRHQSKVVIAAAVFGVVILALGVPVIKKTVDDDLPDTDTPEKFDKEVVDSGGGSNNPSNKPSPGEPGGAPQPTSPGGGQANPTVSVPPICVTYPNLSTCTPGVNVGP